MSNTKSYFINHLRDGSICLGDRITTEIIGTYQEAVDAAKAAWDALKCKSLVTVHSDKYCIYYWHIIRHDGRREDRNTNSGVNY